MREGEHSAVENGKHGEPLDSRGKCHGCFGKDGKAKSEESIGAHFQQEPGQNNATCGRRFSMCICNPAVERDHRNLDCESNEQRQEDPGLDLRRIPDLREREDIERMAAHVVQGQKSNEQQKTSRQAEDDELDCRLSSQSPSPVSNHEIHGNHRDFPEDEEENSIQGSKHTH